ncbi:hypothetical protein Bca4012_079071 [Brassica carinata]
MDPFSKECSFQNLLNSQQPNTSFSILNREPSIEVTSSDAKWAEDDTEDEHTDKVSSKRRKLNDQSAQSASFVPGCDGEDEASARPIGVKAAKGKGKSKAKTSDEAVEFQGIWEIKQRDFELKEKLNKQKLLDSLIAKTEPLDELEISLKNKLITDMLLS